MNQLETEFVIYIINAIANEKSLKPSFVYSQLEKTACIGEYLVPFYDVLHTQGTRKISDDVVEFVNRHGGQL